MVAPTGDILTDWPRRVRSAMLFRLPVTPVCRNSPESPAAQQIQAVADKLAIRSDSLVGKNLNLGVN